MIDFSHIIHRTADDSYVITKNGMPYHVYPYAAEFAQEWDEVFAYAEAHPECVTEEQPYVAPTPTQEELAASVRAERDRRSLKRSRRTAKPCAIFLSNRASLGVDLTILRVRGLKSLLRKSTGLS